MGRGAAGTPAALSAPGGIKQIPALVEQWREAGLTVHYEPEPLVAEDLPETVNRAAFRVIQEGLTNVARHAPQAQAWVKLARRDGELHLAVSNSPGTAGPAVPGSGLGLAGLAERLGLLGGALEHGPGPDGFELSARIPVNGQVRA